jgi:hypothetical protein
MKTVIFSRSIYKCYNINGYEILSIAKSCVILSNLNVTHKKYSHEEIENTKISLEVRLG